MILCLNCLEHGTANEILSVPIGPEKGSQRDPYQEKLLLCRPCGTALVNGELATFHERYRPSRQVTREVGS